MGNLLRAVVCAVSFAVSSPAVGAPVNYDEGIDGDLGTGDYGGLPTFMFAYGTNQFRGTSLYDNTPPDPADWIFDGDSVRFVLPGPARLTIAYQAFSDPIPNTALLREGFALLSIPFGHPTPPPGPCIPIVFACLPVDLLTQSPQTLLADFTTDWTEWYFANTSFQALGVTPGEGGGGTWSYRLTFRVNPTAEPATLALLGFALAGLGFCRRRKLH